MKLSQDKNPIILGLILVFTGFLLALIVITRINASDLYDLSQDTPFLISSDYDSSVFGFRVGSGSTSWIREEFGLLYANLNDNNNVSSFTDQITYQVTASDSWSDSYAVKRGGFNASNFGIVSGSLLTPENGFIFDNSVEEFHLSKNQWVRVFPCPRQLDYGVSQGYYQIYFYDAYKDFMSGSTIDAGRHPVICMCIPQEHYNEFVLTTDSFEYPYQDYKVFYYDYSMSSGGSLIGWVGILPLPFSFEYGYTLAYSDRSVQIRANGNRVKIESMKFADQVPSPTPTASPSPSPEPEIESIICRDVSGNYYMFDFYVSNFGDPLSFELDGNNALSSVLSSYSLQNNWISPSVWQMYWSSGSYRSHLFVYFSGIVSDVVQYSLGKSLSSSDFSVLRSSYTGVSVQSSTSGNVLFNSSEGLFGFDFCPYHSEYTPYFTALISSSFSFMTRTAVSEGSNYVDLFNHNQVGLTFPLYAAYTLGLEGSSGESGGPSPTPSPSPSPVPTDPPYVVIVTPVPEASPTPPIHIVTSGPMPSWFPPGDPLIPLDSEIQDDVFGNFSGKVSDNAAFGFLGLLMALIPSEAIWFLWFLLFILVVLGIAKVIIHFTGG